MFSAADVAAAATRLTGVARRTPLHHNDRLTAATGVQVWLKREDLQVGRSYKLRGAYNLLAQLDDGERAAGAVCA
ncbi:MAG: threonine dehydratase, partial [Pseudonocardia sp.]|nr:threonine dehydratase [Pseudonocardia sp.]